MGFPNANRGLRLADTDFVYLTEGAYGLIFVSQATGRIRKLYRHNADENHVRAVFKAETDAYALVMKTDELATLVPGNFRLCPRQRVFDGAANEVSGEVFPDMAFETDFVVGQFLKIGFVYSPEAQRVRERFHALGINHTTDMSVCLTPEGRVAKVIDFAIEEHPLSHSD